MRTLRRIVLVSMLFAGMLPAAYAGGAVYALRVDGLACPFCAYGIEKKLSSIEGVKNIKVNIEKGEVIVTMAGEAKLPEPLARAKIKDAGFTLRAFTEQSAESKP